MTPSGSVDIAQIRASELSGGTSAVQLVTTDGSPRRAGHLLVWDSSGKNVIDGGAVPAPGGGAMTNLGEVILSSSASTVTFSSISSGYRNLKIFATCRSDQSSPPVIYIQFNGDTGANYDAVQQYGGSSSGNTTAFGSPQAQIANATGTGAPSGQAASLDITILDYARTVWNKNGVASTNRKDNLSSGMYSGCVAFSWRNTAAITSVTIGLSSGNFVSGSVFTLYGLQ